jgi:hypothetical protein
VTSPVRFIEHGAGLTWIAAEPAFMQRASHAVPADGRVWVIDPVDGPGVEERILAQGRPAAVVQLLDRHERDCLVMASRLGVAHLRLPRIIEGSPFQAFPVVSLPGWREVALWWPEGRGLIVAEAVGTVRYYLAPRDRLAVHPFLRLTPPRGLRGLEPEHLLVGHGDGLHGPDAARALDEALRTARRRFPSFLAGLPGSWRAKAR